MQLHARRLWTAAFVVWLIVVWGHSLMPADVSSQESAGPVALLMPLFELIGISSVHTMTRIVRKVAHFSEYAVLMVLYANVLRAWEVTSGRKRTLLLLAVWVLVPSIDETIQLFVPDREGMVLDVLLDMCGGAFGYVLATRAGRTHMGRMSDR